MMDDIAFANQVYLRDNLNDNGRPRRVSALVVQTDRI